MNEINETAEAWSEADKYKREQYWKKVAQTLSTFFLYLLFAIITILALSVTIRIATWILP